MRHAWCICESIDSEILVTREFYHGSQEILPLSRTLCGVIVRIHGGSYITMRRHAWYICESIDSEKLVTRGFYHSSQETLPLSRTLCGVTVRIHGGS
jgi:hypothetical protein